MDPRPPLVALLAALVAAFLLAERGRRPMVALALKAAASACFVALGLLSGHAATGPGRWLLAGLALAAAGDVLLATPRTPQAGILVFVLAHLAYIVCFAQMAPAWWVAAVAAAALAGPALLAHRWVRPGVPPALRAAVGAYVAIITAMVAVAAGAAAGGGPAWGLVGASLFYVSDLAWARGRFVAPGFVNRAVGVPLYYAAQTTLALGGV